MRKVMFALAIAVGALMVLQPANAQMTDPVNTRTSIGRYHGRAPSTGVHWCTWSAATVCSKWRARAESTFVRRARDVNTEKPHPATNAF